jgi:phosphohistidine phosphatase
MKQIFLIRHAKSSWNDSSVRDIDRPLNDRGREDAPDMARRLKKRDIKIDRLVSSPAKRAKQTAKLFAEELGIDKDDVLIVPDLYEANENDFLRTILGLKDKWNSVAIFSHNPGILAFAGALTTTELTDMPTCAIFGARVDTEEWKEFPSARKEFLFFDYPKAE